MATLTRGFTLIEALVTLTLVALCISFGAPALGQFIRNQQLVAAYHELLASLSQARQESVTRRIAVLVDNQDGNWQTGWKIYADRNGNARWDEGEPIIKQVGAQPNGLIIKGNGPVRRYIRYTPTGQTYLLGGAFQAGTLTLCNADGKTQVRKLVLNATGRVRRVKQPPGPC